MNKEILIETNRIKEIMGVKNKPLISEQWQELANLIKDMRNVGTISVRGEKLLADMMNKKIIGDVTKEAEYIAFVGSTEGKAAIRELEALVARLKQSDPMMGKIADDIVKDMKDPVSVFSASGRGGGSSVYTALAPEVEALFGKVNLQRYLTPKEVQFLEGAHSQIMNGIQKLSKSDYLVLESELKGLGLDLNSAIARARNANDAIARAAAENGEKMLAGINKILSKGSKLKFGALLDISWKILVVVILVRGYNKVQQWELLSGILPKLPSPIGPDGSDGSDGSNSSNSSNTNNNTSNSSNSSNSSNNSSTTPPPPPKKPKKDISDY